MAGYDNISYFAGTSATEALPQSVLTGDGNIDGPDGGLNLVYNKFVDGSIDAVWSSAVHERRGNIALADGSASSTTTAQLKDQIASARLTGSDIVVISKPQGTL